MASRRSPTSPTTSIAPGASRESRSIDPRCATPFARTPSTSCTGHWMMRARTLASVSCFSPAMARARKTAAGPSAPEATSASAAAMGISTRGRVAPHPPVACTSSRCSASSASCRRWSSRSYPGGRPAADTPCMSSATSRSRVGRTAASSRRMPTSEASTADTAAPISPARWARSLRAKYSSSPESTTRSAPSTPGRSTPSCLTPTWRRWRMSGRQRS